MSEQQQANRAGWRGGSPGGTDKNPNYEPEGSSEGEGLEGGGGGDGGRKTQLCEMLTSQKLVTNLVEFVLLKKSIIFFNAQYHK